MKRALLAILILSMTSSAFARKLLVVELSGTPYERGVQHGRALRQRIRDYVPLWKNGIKDETGMDPDAFIAAFLRDRDFLPATRRRMPEMIDEVHGIADGAGIPFETAWAMQLGDEQWDYESHLKNHCSALGVPREGAHPAFVAQNMDIEPFNDGFQTVLHIRGTPEQYVFTVAGQVALNGMNGASIGVVTNTLSQLRSSADGLPVAFVVRGILRSQTTEEALAFVRSVRHASGQNYIIGAGDRRPPHESRAGERRHRF